ncbi:acyl-CoA/acyl-ACP dehydrogenase [Frankia sp. AgB1.9]|uniref:acyl-CoA dehydrogenase family protein n=1 Tax=unclassified Frankia TaxID=2632575 RepID=UPI001932AEAE|nr:MULTISPECIES: acyl-CoA dehydrogenase family protein [unclassified Frankia]MBL7488316.1 acyl-CoA/acyl-ACP dehydrogenase [Frankia sp. AgW1.1]MBL7548529.1 acyl-CoA/acyl-ACP dehydrogenase [Frankia sp. AgB1.9]MBL7619574.1 acyl-CoA/acyl-ACP dehydrogenase [Frankia sp. AgB1.8]
MSVELGGRVENTHVENKRVDGAGLAREVVAAIATRAGEADRLGELPAADLDDLRTAGLLGLLVPRRLGGLGGTFADWADAARVLAEGSGSTALALNMHTSVVGALAGTPDELARAMGAPESYFTARDRVLAQAAAGSFIAVAMSERGAGSRLSGLRTSYRREGDGYRITGLKSFCSGASHADLYFVAARAADDTGDDDDTSGDRTGGDDGQPAGKVSHFLVPAGAGVTVEPNWDTLGMRGTGSHDLRLDVRVPADALIGGLEGLSLLIAQIMPQWLVASYAAVYAGVGRATFNAGVEHARGRTAPGLPNGLVGLPAVRARFGRADVALAALDLVVDECARRVDADPGSPATNSWVWRAKLLAGQTAQDVATSIVEACGTAVTRRGHPLERLYRDARCGSLQPATSDVCADWLGLAALGGDPDADADVPRW